MHADLKPYFEIAQKNTNIQMLAYTGRWFHFLNTSDKCEVNVFPEVQGRIDGEYIINVKMIKIYPDKHFDDIYISLEEFIKYIS